MPHDLGVPVSGDIEEIAHWALGRKGQLSWRNPADWELSLDQGLTARPRRKARGHWYLVEVGAHQMALRDRLPGPRTLRRVPGDDAATVFEAIKSLPAAAAAAVIMYSRARTRPGFIAVDGVSPRPELRPDGKVRIIEVEGPKRARRRVAPFCPLAWPVDLEVICASHRAYSTWHDGMSLLAKMLDGHLKVCNNIWFSAPATPWERAAIKAA